MIFLVGGHVQSQGGVGVPNGSISLQLNLDATIVAAPGGLVPAQQELVFQFDATGNLVQPAQIWANGELNPQNSSGLGTYYLVTIYDANGARINSSPMWWQFPQLAGATVDISFMTAVSTIGGNVIFYPNLSGSAFNGVNPQIANYTATLEDSGKLIVFSSATPVTLHLPATVPSSSWFVLVENIGSGALTIDRNGNTIDSVASNLTVPTSQGVFIGSGGTSYFTERGLFTSAPGPDLAVGLQYVAAVGNDSNDGLTWNTPKATIMAAYDALPSGGGTVYIAGPSGSSANWPSATSTPGQGIWIMGPGDTNYATPPAGWRLAKNGGLCQVAFIGVPGALQDQNAMSGLQAIFVGGSNSTPAIWLSGVTGVTFQNLASQYPKSLVWIAIDSTGVKSQANGGSNITFDNCSVNVDNGGGNPSAGPCVNIGSNCFWVRFTNCGFNCNGHATSDTINRCAVYIDEGVIPNANVVDTELIQFAGNAVLKFTTSFSYVSAGQRVTISGTTNGSGYFNGTWTVAAAAFNVPADPTPYVFYVNALAPHSSIPAQAETGTLAPAVGNEASGIIYFENCDFTGGGGIRYENFHEGTAGHYVRNCNMEGTGDSQPIYEVISNNGVFQSTLFFSDGISDSGNNPPKVKIASGINPSFVRVFGGSYSNGMDFAGPLTVFGGSQLQSIGTGTVTADGGIAVGITSPQAQGQKGSIFAKTLDQVDTARRQFVGLARFQNLATQLPSAWVATDTGSVTTGQTAPDGTTNAGLVAHGSSTSQFVGMECGPAGDGTYNAGDYLYFGVWVRPQFPALNGVMGPGPGLYTVFGATGLNMRLIAGSYGVAQNGEGFTCPPCVQDDGGWQWVWGLLKATTGASVSYHFRALLDAVANCPAFYYAPVFCQIPSSAAQTVATTTVHASATGATQSGNICHILTTTAHGLIPGQLVIVTGVAVGGYNGEWVVATTPSSTTFTFYNPTTGLTGSGGGSVIPGNDSEIADWALQISSYPENITAGPTLATLRGVNLAFGGSGDAFHAILDHTALTADHTFLMPNTDGTIVVGTGSGFGNGSSGTAVTTTTKSTGTGPTTPQTVVNYLEITIAGTAYWVPLVQ